MMGGGKLRAKLRAGPLKREELARLALVAAAGAAMANATNTSASQTASHAPGVTWCEARNAAARAVAPIATPPQPGTAVKPAAPSPVSRMVRRGCAGRASIGSG